MKAHWLKFAPLPFLAALLLASTSWAATPAAGGSQAELEQASKQQKFAFLLFYKQNDAATAAAAKTLNQNLAARKDAAVAIFVNAADPAEKALVEKYEVSRAPMPITLAIAPNGAITGIFQQKLSKEMVDEAFVTPTMTRCMKAMQEGKLVLLCVDTAASSAVPASVPASVRDFQADPQFASRLAVVNLRAGDPAESRFHEELELDPAKLKGPMIVLMAPPGVMIGKYNALATKSQMAADLHAAGKCCDDPNCKHNQKGK